MMVSFAIIDVCHEDFLNRNKVSTKCKMNVLPHFCGKNNFSFELLFVYLYGRKGPVWGAPTGKSSIEVDKTIDYTL